MSPHSALSGESAECDSFSAGLRAARMPGGGADGGGAAGDA